MKKKIHIDLLLKILFCICGVFLLVLIAKNFTIIPATPTSSHQTVSPQKKLKPVSVPEGWQTFSTSNIALAYPNDWQIKKVNNYNFSLVKFKGENQEISRCPGVTDQANLSYFIEPTGKVIPGRADQYSEISEKDFYDIDHPYWGGAQLMSYNGGKGTVTHKVVTIGDQQAVEKKILWTEGIECFTKPRVQYEYYFYLGNQKQFVIYGYYFPDEEFAKITDSIFSTINLDLNK